MLFVTQKIEISSKEGNVDLSDVGEQSN